MSDAIVEVCVRDLDRLRGRLESLSDECLVLLIQQGLPAAWKSLLFEELLVTRYSDLLSIAFRCRGVAADRVDDLIQVLHVKFWTRGVYRFDPKKGDFRCYLRTAALNLWRQDVRRCRHTVSLDGATALASDPPPDVGVLEQEDRERLERALCRLPESEQRILRGRMDGMTPENLVEATGRELKEVYRLLHRARRRLAEDLGLSPPRYRSRSTGSPQASEPAADSSAESEAES